MHSVLATAATRESTPVLLNHTAKPGYSYKRESASFLTRRAFTDDLHVLALELVADAGFHCRLLLCCRASGYIVYTVKTVLHHFFDTGSFEAVSSRS